MTCSVCHGFAAVGGEAANAPTDFMTATSAKTHIKHQLVPPNATTFAKPLPRHFPASVVAIMSFLDKKTARLTVEPRGVRFNYPILCYRRRRRIIAQATTPIAASAQVAGSGMNTNRTLSM